MKDRENKRSNFLIFPNTVVIPLLQGLPLASQNHLQLNVESEMVLSSTNDGCVVLQAFEILHKLLSVISKETGTF